MHSVFYRLIIACIALSLTTQVRASGPERFAEFIGGTLSATAKFEQKIYDRSGKLLQQSSGTLVFQRPGKFRWVYMKPYPQTIVGDGVRVWIYDEDLQQVTVKKLDRALGSTPAALLAGNSEAMHAFRLSDQGTRDGLEWLDALPRDREGNFEKIRIGFGFSGPETMELSDSFGQLTVLKFTSFQRNAKVDAAQFRFTPPKGVDVLGDSPK